MIWIHFK